MPKEIVYIGMKDLIIGHIASEVHQKYEDLIRTPKSRKATWSPSRSTMRTRKLSNGSFRPIRHCRDWRNTVETRCGFITLVLIMFQRASTERQISQ